MKELVVLISPVVWSLKNDITRFNRSFYRKILFYLCSSAVFVILVTKLLGLGMRRLQSLSPDVFSVLVIKGYSVIFLIVLVIQVINGIALSLNTFFQSNDLEVLLTSPVKRTALFFSKLIETHIKASWMLIIFGIPLLLSLGLFYRQDLFYYFVAVVLFAFFSFIPVNIGAGLAIFLASIFHVRRMKRFLLSTGIVAVVLLVTLLRVFRPERFVNPELFANLTLFLSEMRTPSFIALPSRWLSEAIFAFLGNAGSTTTLIFIALLFLTPYVTTLFVYFVFMRYHSRGWVQLQEGGTLTRERIAHGAPGLFAKVLRLLTGMLGEGSRMLVTKDLLCQARDAKNIHQVLILLSLVIIYLFSIASLPLNWEGYAVELRYMLSFFNLGLILIIIAALCSRIVYPAMVSEGNFLWILRTSPITAKRYIVIKFLLFCVPILMVGELLGLFSSFFIGIERALMLLILVTIALLSVSLVSVAVVFGIADLKKGITLLEERGKAGSVAQMLVSIFLILLTVGMEAVPISLFFVKEAAKMVLTQKAWVAIGAVAVAVLLVNACATAYALRKSIKSIGTLELN